MNNLPRDIMTVIIQYLPKRHIIRSVSSTIQFIERNTPGYKCKYIYDGKGYIPEHVTHLYGLTDNVKLPSSLVSLTLSVIYFGDIDLSQCYYLKEITFGSGYIGEDIVLPDTLEYINFNSAIPSHRIKLPKSVRQLCIDSIHLDILTPWIQSLTITGMCNINLDTPQFDNILELTIYECVEHLPKNLKKLSMLGYGNIITDCSGIVLPESIEEIIMSHHYYGYLVAPETLRKVTLSYSSSRLLKKPTNFEINLYCDWNCKFCRSQVQ